jgi:hypothetical protein
MQDESFPEMNHLVNVKISSSERSINSSESEDRQKVKLKGLDLKKSEYVVEEEESIIDSKVEPIRTDHTAGKEERTLRRSREEGLLVQINGNDSPAKAK